jgi:hypothetical protein
MIRSNLRFRWAPVLAACALGSVILAACGDGGASEQATAPAERPGASLGTQPTPTDTETTADVDRAEPAATPESRADEPAATEAEVAAETTAAPDPEPEPATEPPAEQPIAEPADPAPALGSIDSWHNSEPLALDQLRGSPVLLVFWADF